MRDSEEDEEDIELNCGEQDPSIPWQPIKPSMLAESQKIVANARAAGVTSYDEFRAGMEAAWGPENAAYYERAFREAWEPTAGKSTTGKPKGEKLYGIKNAETAAREAQGMPPRKPLAKRPWERKPMHHDDFSLAAVMGRIVKAQGGKELSPAQLAKMEATAKELEEAKEELAYSRGEISSTRLGLRELTAKINDIVAQGKREAGEKPAPKPPFAGSREAKVAAVVTKLRNLLDRIGRGTVAIASGPAEGEKSAPDPVIRRDPRPAILGGIRGWLRRVWVSRRVAVLAAGALVTVALLGIVFAPREEIRPAPDIAPPPPAEAIRSKPITVRTTTHGEGIRRSAVASSALRSVGYDEGRRILEIEFTNGAVYRYFDVPAEVYRGLMAAASHGRYFNRQVRNAGYRYEKLK
ncbi:MAG: KTSC domain-containing protein [Thermoguttaceae bacterium]|jgi:hypothetical protein